MPVPIISRLRQRERGLIVQIEIFLPSSEVAVGRVEKNGAEKVFRFSGLWIFSKFVFLNVFIPFEMRRKIED